MADAALNDPNDRESAVDRGGTLYTSEERQEFIELSAPVDDEWVADMNKRGFDGKKLLQSAKDLIAKHGKA